MVHHEAHALAPGIGVERLDVEVGVGGDEVEHIVLGVAGPVFPTFVPALYEHLVEAMLGGEVDVAAHVLIGSSVASVA